MASFYFKIADNMPIKVIPETRVLMDGHPILTHSYSIYKDVDNLEPSAMADDQDKQSDLNYLGYVTFEIPGKLFNYVADGPLTLSRDQIEQIIEAITHYRDNPHKWKGSNN